MLETITQEYIENDFKHIMPGFLACETQPNCKMCDFFKMCNFCQNDWAHFNQHKELKTSTQMGKIINNKKKRKKYYSKYLTILARIIMKIITSANKTLVICNNYSIFMWKQIWANICNCIICTIITMLLGWICISLFFP